jgi:hypothetical protein
MHLSGPTEVPPGNCRGTGILENAYGGTADVHGLTANEIGADREGKDISGSGFDMHVIGRARMPVTSDAARHGECPP